MKDIVTMFTVNSIKDDNFCYFKVQYSHFFKFFRYKKMEPNLFYPKQRCIKENGNQETQPQPAEKQHQMLHGNKNDFTVNIRYFAKATHGKALCG